MIPLFRNILGVPRTGRKSGTNLSISPFVDTRPYFSTSFITDTSGTDLTFPLGIKIGGRHIVTHVDVSTNVAIGVNSTFTVEIWLGDVGTGSLAFTERQVTGQNLTSFITRQIRLPVPVIGELSEPVNIVVRRTGSIQLSINISSYLRTTVQQITPDFSPPFADDLDYWFSSDTNVFRDINGAPASDGDLVFGWINSGNGGDAIQRTANRRLTYKSTGISGLPYLTAKSVDERFFENIPFTVPLDSTAETQFTVCVFLDNIIPSNNCGVLGTADNPGGLISKADFGFRSTSGQQILFTKDNFRFVFGNIENPVIFIARPDAGSTGSPIRYIKNNNSTITDTNGNVTNLIGGGSSLQLLRRGTLNNETFDGDIYEIMIYSRRIVDDNDLIPINEYFMEKYLNLTPLPLTNNGAETGNINGWTSETGNFGVRSANPAPYDGNFYFFGGNQILGIMSQNNSFPNEYLNDIDAGLKKFYVRWAQASFAGADDGSLQIQFLDAGNNVLSTTTSSLASPGQSWLLRYLLVDIPPLARSYTIRLRAERDSGTNNDAYFDLILPSILDK